MAMTHPYVALSLVKKADKKLLASIHEALRAGCNTWVI
jgi:hypothetical protein